MAREAPSLYKRAQTLLSELRPCVFLRRKSPAPARLSVLVEVRGFEPLASGLQSPRYPS